MKLEDNDWNIRKKDNALYNPNKTRSVKDDDEEDEPQNEHHTDFENDAEQDNALEDWEDNLHKDVARSELVNSDDSVLNPEIAQRGPASYDCSGIKNYVNDELVNNKGKNAENADRYHNLNAKGNEFHCNHSSNLNNDTKASKSGIDDENGNSNEKDDGQDDGTDNNDGSSRLDEAFIIQDIKKSRYGYNKDGEIDDESNGNIDIIRTATFPKLKKPDIVMTMTISLMIMPTPLKLTMSTRTDIMATMSMPSILTMAVPWKKKKNKPVEK